VKRNHKTIICLPYDINQIYSFWCARYRDISYEEFLKIKKSEFMRKIESIPENEPLYKIIQSRVIDTSSIKNKEERRYWNKLKRINKIPDIYLSNEEIDLELKQMIGGNKNGNGFNKI
jgi:hypothetical protein